MPLSKKDHLGRRGENIAFVRLAEVCQANDLPYFVPHFLGDKCPLFDALVELVGVGNKTPYFFAQVKATREGYNAKGRLKVKVEKSDVIGVTVHPTSGSGLCHAGKGGIFRLWREGPGTILLPYSGLRRPIRHASGTG